MFNKIKSLFKKKKILEAGNLTVSEIDEKIKQGDYTHIDFGVSTPLIEVKKAEPIGDGNAAFFGEPTPEEELEFKRDEEGTLPWYKRLANLGKDQDE